jgi:hypothetical protein
MANNQKKLNLVCTAILLLITISGGAQFTLSGQLRTRTEVRNGTGNLVPKGSKSAVFTSQRTRLVFGYKWDRILFAASIQDVRVWGQDASSISNTEGARFMLHEGWAEITLANKADSLIRFKPVDFLALKIGRQELQYDDVRLIGNLDWLQQARRHDMALLKMMHRGWQAELGYAFNQNTDAFGIVGTSYVPGNLPAYIKNSVGVLVPTPSGIMPLTTGGSPSGISSKTGAPVLSNPPNTNAGNQQYKSFTSLYISKKVNHTKVSALFFNDHFGKYKLDSIVMDGGYVYGRRFVATPNDNFDYTGTSSRYTYGGMIIHTIGKETAHDKIILQGAYYGQSGEDRDGVGLNAFHYMLMATWQTGKFGFTPGYDVLSGNDAASPSGKNNRFDPLYGTPHKHWGYMDYFYAGTGSAAGGLKNLYFKTKYTAKSLIAGIDLHSFALHKDMKKSNGEIIDKSLGTELDLLLNYSMNKFTTVELGGSLMKATGSMPFAKGQATTDAAADIYRKTGTWFYAMIRIAPELFSSKSPGGKL